MIVESTVLLKKVFWVFYWFDCHYQFVREFDEDAVDEALKGSDDESSNSQGEDSRPWWEVFTGYYDGIFKVSDGYIEDPSTIMITFSENIKLLIEFHAGDTYYLIHAPEMAEPEMLGCVGPHHSFPIFRWEELLGLVSTGKLEPSIKEIEKDLILLVLCPTAWLTQEVDAEEASKAVVEAWKRTGLTDGAGAVVLTHEWQRAVSLGNEYQWWWDNEIGWVTNAENNYCRRLGASEPSTTKRVNEIIRRATNG